MFRLTLLIMVLSIPWPSSAQEPSNVELGSAVPARHELPWSERNSLPEIKLTLWHFDPDDNHRWAKINGQRVGEGDTLENGVEVLSIRPDGVVCRFEGREFLVGTRR